MYRIKEVIKSKGFTLQEIADGLGVTKMSISSRINGNPSLSNLQEIADFIGVKMKDFFEEENLTENTPIYAKDETGNFTIIGYLIK